MKRLYFQAIIIPPVVVWQKSTELYWPWLNLIFCFFACYGIIFFTKTFYHLCQNNYHNIFIKILICLLIVVIDLFLWSIPVFHAIYCIKKDTKSKKPKEIVINGRLIETGDEERMKCDMAPIVNAPDWLGGASPDKKKNNLQR